MAFAIACWVRDTALTLNKRDIEYTKAFMNSIFRNDTIINTAIPGMRGYKSVKNTNEIKKAQEYAWLYKG